MARDPARPDSIGQGTLGRAPVGQDEPEQVPDADLVPNIEVPRGGGALRGLGESFETQAFTGSASLSIPIPTPDARGFGPGLMLAYASGAGNGPFGLGFSLSPPRVARKTDRGLPRYLDEEESDVFVLTGAEDLVPALDDDGERIAGPGEHLGRTYVVHRYRPRIETDFGRIERWVDPTDHTSFWRVTSRGNVISYFGRSAQSRVSDPEAPWRIFEWLLDRVEDDRGNASDYLYKAEDDAGVDASQPWEASRSPTAEPQRYLKRIRYGNRVAPEQAGAAIEPERFAFEVVLDYGEHGERLADDEPLAESVAVSYEEVDPWPMRPDVFSTFRPTFDLRTRRLCRRVLVFHRFAELEDGRPTLTRSLDLGYDESPVASLLRSATYRGYVSDGDGTYRAHAAPPLRLDYTSAEIQPELRVEDARGITDLGSGLAGSSLRLVDLDGEGAPGLLWTSGRTWIYKRAVGDASFAPGQVLDPMPTTGVAEVRLLDLDGDGRLSLVSLDGAAPGSYERTRRGGWERHRSLRSRPTADLDDPHVRMLDVDGDGLTDILVDRGDRFEWYASLGREGFAPPVVVSKPRDEARGAQLVYRDRRVAILHADMNGDGLLDLVRVQHGSVVYWPNRGFGRFGPRVIMGNVPSMGRADAFSADRVRLSDIDGSGTADLLVFDDEGAFVCLNASGNRFMPPQRLRGVPPVSAIDHADIADIDGLGVGSLVWSSSLPMTPRLRIVRLLEDKPYLLAQVTNGRGLERRIRYVSSTELYMRDREAGRPWVTRLPFPVQVVEAVEVVEHVTGHRMVTTYAYHHGYFDGAEREFRGFGLVEQRDAESFEAGPEHSLDVPPVLTRTWFHTGAYLGGERIATQLAQEYWDGDAEAVQLPDTVLPEGLRPEEAQEAVRALKGAMLRQEVYAEDGSAQAGVPYSVAERSLAVRIEQPRAGQRHAVFFVHEREQLTYHYERVVYEAEDGDQPPMYDPRLQQSATLEVDEFGNVRRSVVVGYPRRVLAGMEAQGPVLPEQRQTSVVVNEGDSVNQTGDGGPYRLGVPVQARSFELTNQAGDPRQPWSWQALRDKLDAAPAVGFEAEVGPDEEVRRLLSAQQIYYYTGDLTGMAPLGQPGARALPYETRAAAFSDAQVAEVFGPAVDAELLQQGAYVLEEVELDDGELEIPLWWTRSGRQVFDPTRFYLPVAVIDPFGNETSIEYDDSALLVTELTDPVGNTVRAEYDYRVLAPSLVTDPNGNRVAAGYDGLGQLERTAVLGKPGDELDSLDEPTSLLEYDLWSWLHEGEPLWMHTQLREHHGADPGRWLEAYEYVDGRGQTVMVKTEAQPGTVVYDETLTEPVERWVASGRTIYNNKGLPVRQYEPFFSPTPEYEDEAELVEHGVTSVFHYDPLGRMIRTEFPNGTEARVEFTPWVQRAYDPNDTVLGSRWYAERMTLPAGDPERRAAALTEAHADTPLVTHLDHLGREVLVVEHDRDASGNDEFYETRVVLDVQGNVLRIVDANGTVADDRTYGMLGQVLHTESIEVGERWALTDVQNAPLWSTASRGFSARFEYDQARRPTYVRVTGPNGTSFTATRTVYGEAAPTPEARNLRGQLYRIYDGAGLLENEAFDVDGNLVRQSRRLAVAYATTPDWSPLDELEEPAAMDAAAAGLLEEEAFTTEARFDALGRPVTQTMPDASETSGASVLHLGYGDAGYLETVAANVRGAEERTTYVEDLRYDARGQRTLVVYGNGTQTRYAYDPETFRLTELRTTRIADGHPHQDLSYTYDPVGNITEIRDAAQPVVFTSNAAVSADQHFVYSAVYRLRQAEGREHQSQGQPTAEGFAPRAAPDDPTGLRRYTEEYLYDAVGNILQMQHAAPGNGWTRGYRYDYETSGNQLLATSAPEDVADVFNREYEHDPHGNMTAMPHLAVIDYDWADRMQWADLGGGGSVYFTYDASGQRVRKLRVNQNESATWERVYLGGFEVYRERVGGELRLERETLHIGDNAGRVCLVETKTVEDGERIDAPANVSRYQYSNHLGSVHLELDEVGRLISYEEYHPYGTTSYRAVNATLDVSPKLYRYTGKERDEETGLYYHGARYYAPWLGRWTAADPIGLRDGVNRYMYAHDDPVGLMDPGGALAQGPEDSGFALETEYQYIETVSGRERTTIYESARIHLRIGELEWTLRGEVHHGEPVRRTGFTDRGELIRPPLIVGDEASKPPPPRRPVPERPAPTPVVSRKYEGTTAVPAERAATLEEGLIAGATGFVEGVAIGAAVGIGIGLGLAALPAAAASAVGIGLAVAAGGLLGYELGTGGLERATETVSRIYHGEATASEIRGAARVTGEIVGGVVAGVRGRHVPTKRGFRPVSVSGAAQRWWPRISAVAPDWATKGAHIHVGGIELAARPTHRGKIVFRSVFSGQDPHAVERAIHVATRALGEVGFRQRLFNASGRAVSMMEGGKGAELRFLMRALEKMGL